MRTREGDAGRERAEQPRIAAQVAICERTAGARVEHILDKLGFASRTQIVVWAAEHELDRGPSAAGAVALASRETQLR